MKRGDKRAAAFLKEHGPKCAEVDALPPDELRRRVKEAILSHVDQEQWERLLRVEAAERETVALVAAQLAKPNLDSFSSERGEADV